MSQVRAVAEYTYESCAETVPLILPWAMLCSTMTKVEFTITETLDATAPV